MCDASQGNQIQFSLNDGFHGGLLITEQRTIMNQTCCWGRRVGHGKVRVSGFRPYLTTFLGLRLVEVMVS